MKCPNSFKLIYSQSDVIRTAGSISKKKQVNLSTADKTKILDPLRSDKTREALVNETSVGHRTLKRWVANESKIR